MRAPASTRPSLPDLVSAAAAMCVQHARVLLPLAIPGALLAAAGSYALLTSAPAPVEGAGPTADQIQRGMLEAAPWLAVAAIGRVFTHVAVVAAAIAIGQGRSITVRAALAGAVRALPVGLLTFLAILLTVSLLSATIFLLPLALYLLVSWVFSAQLIVEDGAGPLRALGDSRRLVKGQWWRTFGISAAVMLLSLLPEIIVAQLAGRNGSDIAASVGSGIAALAGAPFVGAGLTLLYLDARRAKGQPPRPRPSEDAAL